MPRTAGAEAAGGLVGSKPTLRGSSGKKDQTLKRRRINRKRRMPSVLVLQIPSSCPAVQFGNVVMITMTTAMSPSVIVFVLTGWQMMVKTTTAKKKL